MCIICKTGYEAGGKFLGNWELAIKYIKAAEKNMLDCAKIDKSYDKTHKKIIKYRKMLAEIEQSREH